VTGGLGLFLVNVVPPARRRFSLYERADTLPEIVAEEERQHPLDA